MAKIINNPSYQVIAGDWLQLENIINDLATRFVTQSLTPTSSPIFATVTLSNLTASRLIYTNASKTLTSVSNLASWIAGTANEIEITDDGDGTITVGLIDPLIVSKGGTGLATITDHGILLGSGTDAITPLGVATNGQLPIGSTGADPVLAALTGTSNQITVTNGAGTITLSLPQNIHTGASPTFAGLTLTGLTDTRIPIISTGGLFTDDPDFKFSSSTNTLKINQGDASSGDNCQFLTVYGNPYSAEFTWIAASGSLKLGTTNVNSGAGLWLEGTYGTTPTSGAGTRLMWIPSKSAFRAGISSTVGWNDANIGSYSASFGINNMSNGNGSLTGGSGNTGSGVSTCVFGSGNTVSGNYSFSSGSQNIVSNLASSAFGTEGNVSGEYSSAFGYANTVSGSYACCMGFNNTVSSYYGFCNGVGNTASGDGSVCFGFLSNTTGLFAVTAGRFANANGTGSIALG
jgi:hypothetical protein